MVQRNKSTPVEIGKVSIIVPAWNEEAVLAPSLAALSAAKNELAEPSELIVVDDGSTDRTAEIARSHGARVVAVSHRHIAATRNSGAEAASGDLFIFVDADTIVDGKLLRSAAEAVRRGAIGGGCRVRLEGPLPLWGRTAPVLGNAFQTVVRLAYGCFVFCTREAFEKVGGFDTKLYVGEEIELSRSLKRHGRFVILPHTAVTSGRKLRVYPLRTMLGLVLRALVGGRQFLQTRRGKELWYGERLLDPNRPLSTGEERTRKKPVEASSPASAPAEGQAGGR